MIDVTVCLLKLHSGFVSLLSDRLLFPRRPSLVSAILSLISLPVFSFPLPTSRLSSLCLSHPWLIWKPYLQNGDVLWRCEKRYLILWNCGSLWFPCRGINANRLAPLDFSASLISFAPPHFSHNLCSPISFPLLFFSLSLTHLFSLSLFPIKLPPEPLLPDTSSARVNQIHLKCCGVMGASLTGDRESKKLTDLMNEPYFEW